MCSNRLWRLWDCRQAAEEGPPPRRCRKVSLLGAAAAFAGLLGLAAVSPAAEAPPMRVGSEIAYPPFCSLDAQGRAGALAALVLGDGSGLSREDWQILQDTGTVHLLVISGQHIDLLAAVMYLLVAGLARFGLWPLRWPWCSGRAETSPRTRRSSCRSAH